MVRLLEKNPNRLSFTVNFEWDTYRSYIRLLNDPTENGYLLCENCQGWPEATETENTVTNGLWFHMQNRTSKKEVNGPEENKKAIGLQHHSQNRPSNDYKEEAGPKRYCSLSGNKYVNTPEIDTKRKK